MQQAVQQVQHWFTAYVDDYLSAGGPSAALMDLKRTHSLHVAAHARAIAESEHWSPDDCDIAGLIGLVHDVGRFSQLQEFGTFSDAVSVNHGERGYEILSGDGILDSLDPPVAETVSAGVRYHNRHTIPTNLGNESIRFLHVVRDSDKLDIFRVIHEAIRDGHITNHPEITLNIDLDGPITTAALNEVMTRQNVSYSNVHSLADFGLAQLAWLYDLHFPYAYRMVTKESILEQILAIMPDDPRIDRLTTDIAAHITQQSGDTAHP